MRDKLKALMLPGRYDPRYVPVADGLRALSVLVVAWFHIWQQSWLNPALQVGSFTLDMNPPVRAGYIFVDLMLLLSGFLLYLPYANGKEQPPRVFYLRRALRILPSYLLCLAVMLIYAVTRPDFSDGQGLAKDLAAHLTFTHNLFGFSYNSTRLNSTPSRLATFSKSAALCPTLIAQWWVGARANHLSM